MKSKLAFIATIGLLACKGPPPDFEVIATFPHDQTAFTQGLVTSDSVLFESTGLYSRSELRRVDLRTGATLARHQLDSSRFGEGLAVHAGRLYQLTWREKIAYVYEMATLAPIDSFPFAGEGWGLASDGMRLFLSDGSDSIRVVVPETFAIERVMHVRHQDLPLTQLNELEFFEGRLLANIYESNRIAMINPVDGSVLRILDFGELYPGRASRAAVMNGIAVTPDGRHLLLTGKFWPTLFQVRILPAANP